MAVVLAAACSRPTEPAPREPDLAPAVWRPCVDFDPSPWPLRAAADGLWGEDPALPMRAFAPQERRAPKMPDADKFFAKLGPLHDVGTLRDALLICHVETYSRNHAPVFYTYKLGAPPDDRPRCEHDWDALAGPDTLLRFRFRDDYPITLFGPEDHVGFFVSIPRVTIAKGDSIRVRIWDRDSGTSYAGDFDFARDEYMGEAAGRFDGELPFTLRSPFFIARCNANTQQRPWAERWLASLDREIELASAWKPERTQIAFGTNLALSAASPRYAAGILGWDHPDIQARVARLQEIEAADREARLTLARDLATSAPLLAAATTIATKLGNLQVLRLTCTDDKCTLVLDVDRAIAADVCRSNLARQSYTTIDLDAKFDYLAPTDCAQELSAPRVVMTFDLGRARVVRIQDDKAVQLFRLR